MSEPRSYARARVAPGDSTSSLREGASATRRLSTEETRRRLAGAPAFPGPRCDGTTLDSQARGYEQATGDLVRSPKKRNLLAACYRVHGADFLPLVREWFSRTGTATNLLFELRVLPPQPVTAACGSAQGGVCQPTAPWLPATSDLREAPPDGATEGSVLSRPQVGQEITPDRQSMSAAGSASDGSDPSPQATISDREAHQPSGPEPAELPSAPRSRPPDCHYHRHERTWVQRPDGTWTCQTCHP